MKPKDASMVARVPLVMMQIVHTNMQQLKRTHTHKKDSPKDAAMVARVPLVMFAASFVASFPTKIANR